MDINQKLPYKTKELLGTGGQIRKKIEDFIVKEIPLYEPVDEGEHLYVNITKEGLTTKEVQNKLASVLSLRQEDIGFAGMKDKNARTTQTFSIKTEKIDKEPLEDILEKIREQIPVIINWAKFHKNKLRIGHLLGNKFSIRITDLESIDESYNRARKIIEELKKNGLPNFFGPQRFGFEGKNVQRGLAIIKGGLVIREKWKRRLLISSYQSYLCNLYLVNRLKAGKFNDIMKGDIAKKYETGGMFEVKDAETEQKRYNEQEISFTAPIYGSKMWNATGPSGEFEEKILSDVGLTLEDFNRVKTKGTRRLGRLLIPDIDVKLEENSLIVNFYLPKGSYATIVLREIMKNNII